MIGKRWVFRTLTNGAVFSRLRDRISRNCVTVLMYHELAEDDDDIEAWTVVRKGEFLRQVDYLRAHYDIVTLDEALLRFQRGAAPARPAAVLTFDDGDAGNYEILLPLAESLALPVTVFIATGQVLDQRLYWFDRLVNALQGNRVQGIDLSRDGLRRYTINKRKGADNWVLIEQLLADLKMLSPGRREEITERVVRQFDTVPEPADACRIRPLTIADVKALGASRWIDIGAHSHCHNLLTQLEPHAAEQSIERSRDLLRAWTGQALRHFAYPSGAHNARLLEIVERLGFATALTTEQTLWRATHSRFRIPRVGVGRYDSLEVFKLNLLGGVGPVARELCSAQSLY